MAKKLICGLIFTNFPNSHLVILPFIFVLEDTLAKIFYKCVLRLIHYFYLYWFFSLDKVLHFLHKFESDWDVGVVIEVDWYSLLCSYGYCLPLNLVLMEQPKGVIGVAGENLKMFLLR